MMRRRALLLDRDGVINRAIVSEGRPRPPSSANELEVMPGVTEALARSRSAGFLNIVVTNQPDVARRTQTRAAVEDMNRALMEALPIDDVFVCYHDDSDRCLCRKPLPGLLLQAAQTYDLELSVCYMIGDRWRDIDAGRAAGCRTVLIGNGYNERLPLQPPDLLAGSLLEAVGRIEAELLQRAVDQPLRKT
jgi:D-glycero-D-manno-heptose 1,7-bisphosphate phosphatase